MPDENDKPQQTITPERVKEFVETLDKLAYEKPAGFSAYMATCMSSMKMADFTDNTKKDSVNTKEKTK